MKFVNIIKNKEFLIIVKILLVDGVVITDLDFDSDGTNLKKFLNN